MDLDVRYIAGFFDGEGCIVIKKNTLGSPGHPKWRPSYSLNLSLSNTDRRPLDWVQNNFGGNVCRHEAPSKPKYRPWYSWHISSLKALHFLQWIRPYLLVKGEQAWLGLEFSEVIRGHGGGKGRSITDEQLALREGYYLALQTAKRLVS